MGIVAAGTCQFLAPRPWILDTVSRMGISCHIFCDDVFTGAFIDVTAQTEEPLLLDENERGIGSVRIVTYGTFACNDRGMEVFMAHPDVLLLCMTGKTERSVRFWDSIFRRRLGVVTRKTAPNEDGSMNKRIIGHGSVTVVTG